MKKRINIIKIFSFFILILLNILIEEIKSKSSKIKIEKPQSKEKIKTSKFSKDEKEENKIKNFEKEIEDDNINEIKDEMGFNPFGDLGLGNIFGGFEKNLRNDAGNFSSKSKVFSYSYSKNGKNKKPEKHIRQMSTEEYREKENGKQEKFRKFGEMIKKDNDEPAYMKRKATTNIETENMLLGDGKEEKILNDNEFKVNKL
jgi:hypothetical protein